MGQRSRRKGGKRRSQPIKKVEDNEVPNMPRGSENAKDAGRLFGALLAGALGGAGRAVGEEVVNHWMHH